MTALLAGGYSLACDREGCPARYGPQPGLSRAALRKAAAGAGWSQDRSEYGRAYDRDFCPDDTERN